MKLLRKFKAQEIAICILLFIASLSIAKLISNGKERDRLRQNLNSIALERDSVNGIAITRELTINELKESHSKELMTLKMENISLNRLLRLTQFKLSHRVKDVKVPQIDTVYLPSGSDIPLKGKAIKLDSACMSMSVFTPDGSDTSYVSGSCNVSGMLAFYRGKRLNQHYIFGRKLFRTGPRQPTAKMITNCTGATIKITDIEVIR